MVLSAAVRPTRATRAGAASEGGAPAEPEAPEAVRLLMTEPRVQKVTRQLAGPSRGDAALVRDRLQDTLIALSTLLADEPTPRDLDRLLDLLLLSQADAPA